MSIRFMLSALVAAAGFAATTLCAAPAGAQSVTATFRGRDPEVSRSQPKIINYADCVDTSNAFDFAVQVTNSSGLRLEIWASQGDCVGSDEQRSSSSSTCGLVYRDSSPRNRQILLPMRNIIAALTNPTTATPILENSTDNTLPACSVCDAWASKTSEPQGFTLYFLLVDNQGHLPDGEQSATWTDGESDLKGPDPPQTVSAGTGEGIIVLNWNDSPTVENTASYQFYCDPNRGNGSNAQPISCSSAGSSGTASGGASGSSGAAGTAGTTGGSSGSSGSSATAGSSGGLNCPTSALVPGALPDPNYYCGSATGATASSGNATGLTNGITYAVAVAAVDTAGNVGKLSPVRCATPQEITDFFEAYRQAGGKGGGGFCALSPARRGPLSAAFGLMAAAAAMILRRRRRD